jgi:hypothetical protein
MKELTKSELISKAREYDNVMNEGGEGFNPYRSEIERRDMEEAKKRAALPKSKKEQIADLYEKVRLECGSVAREWGDEEEIEKKEAEFYASIKRIEAEIESDFAAEWTPGITAERRKNWNDWVRTELLPNGGKMTAEDNNRLYEKEKEQGWTMADLKKAVKINNL